MSDDFEYEDDQPQQPRGVVEILPPPKKGLSWPRTALYAFAILVAGKVGYHAIDRLGGGSVAQQANAAAAPVQAGTTELPQHPDAPVEAKKPSPRWFGGITPRTNGELCPVGDEFCGPERQETHIKPIVDGGRPKHPKVSSQESPLYPFCPPERDECWR